MFILLKAKPFLTVVSIRFLFSADADVDARDYSGRKPKHYIKDRTSLWIQSKLTHMTSDRPSYHLPHRSSRGVETESALPPGWVLPSNRLMGMCRWMGSHFHDWIYYNGVAFSIGAHRVTRMGSHICEISGVSKFRQVGIWGIFAQK